MLNDQILWCIKQHEVRGNITTYLHAVLILENPGLFLKCIGSPQVIDGRINGTHTYICICIHICVYVHICISICDYMINNIHTVNTGWDYNHIPDGDIYTAMINAWFEVTEYPGRTETNSINTLVVGPSIFIFKIFIYLALSGLSCSMWNLWLQHVNS